MLGVPWYLDYIVCDGLHGEDEDGLGEPGSRDDCAHGGLPVPTEQDRAFGVRHYHRGKWMLLRSRPLHWKGLSRARFSLHAAPCARLAPCVYPFWPTAQRSLACRLTTDAYCVHLSCTCCTSPRGRTEQSLNLLGDSTSPANYKTITRTHYMSCSFIRDAPILFEQTDQLAFAGSTPHTATTTPPVFPGSAAGGVRCGSST